MADTGAPADAGSGENGGEAGAEDASPSRPILRLRNRRRRRRPPVLGLLPGPAEPAATGDAAAPAATGSRAAALAPGQRSFSAPRRRRRHAPLSAPPVSAEGGTAAAPDAPSETPSGAAPSGQPARPRRRRRRPPAAGSPEAATGQRRPRQEGAPSPRGPGDGQANRRGERGPRPVAREDGPRDAGPGRGRRDGPGGARRDDRRDRGPGRGRGGPLARPVERKLYSIDAVVDRGFEDVEEADGTRRVHWTIVKRTTADQVSRKAISATYVLQREGADSEFPSLGAARSAVNKTIVHPEKLTRSKAEYAAEKK